MEEAGGRVLDEMRQAVLAFDAEAVGRLCRRALAEGVGPLRLFDALREVITRVGEDFAADRIFLPELVGASKAMEAGMAVVREALALASKTMPGSSADGTACGGETVGAVARVALGTVQGDIHSIGKNIVAALLAADGMEVIDLGIDVPAARFIEAASGAAAGDPAAKGGKATPGRPVDVLALSALLTTTAAEQKKVIDRLEAEGLRGRVRVIVGGGAISQEFADQIGADGYGGTAPDAVRLVRAYVAGRDSAGKGDR